MCYAGIRGFSSKLIVGEEASYMKRDFIMKGVLPVYANEAVGMVLITTVEDNFNCALLSPFFVLMYFAGVSEMMDVKIEGEPVFELIAVGPCKPCILAGKGGECPHYERPPWKSGRKYKEVEAIMNDDSIKSRELDGIVTSSKRFLIAQAWFDAFSRRSLREPHVFVQEVPMVGVGLDPHGGGDGSATAIVDVVLTQDRFGFRDVVRCLVLFGFVPATSTRTTKIKPFASTRNAWHTQTSARWRTPFVRVSRRRCPPGSGH